MLWCCWQTCCSLEGMCLCFQPPLQPFPQAHIDLLWGFAKSRLPQPRPVGISIVGRGCNISARGPSRAGTCLCSAACSELLPSCFEGFWTAAGFSSCATHWDWILTGAVRSWCKTGLRDNPKTHKSACKQTPYFPAEANSNYKSLTLKQTLFGKEALQKPR